MIVGMRAAGSGWLGSVAMIRARPPGRSMELRAACAPDRRFARPAGGRGGQLAAVCPAFPTMAPAAPRRSFGHGRAASRAHPNESRPMASSKTIYVTQPELPPLEEF
ncbi:MAG TPA: hypothetical protein VES00_03150, partial [Burkholderiaceae bacterium]|nr:hypothetical protein [Burkholderiaceae bacterium]